MIEFTGVKRVYKTPEGTITALQVPKLTIGDRGLLLIEGGNGCGKTTLLNLIGLIDAPTEGNVTVDGRDIGVLKGKERELYLGKKVSYIFQSGNLAETLSVRENLALVSVDSVAVNEALAEVGLEGAAERYPSELSLGQQQRVAVARAKLKGGDILLADEPTASLDVDMSAEVETSLKKLSEEMSVIVVTHEAQAMRALCDRRIVLDEGRVVEDSGPRPDAYRDEENRREKCSKETGFNLSVKSNFFLACRSVRRHWFGSIVQLFLIFVMLTAIGLVSSYPIKDKYKQLADICEEQGYDYLICQSDEYAEADFIPMFHAPISNEGIFNNEPGSDIPQYYFAFQSAAQGDGKYMLVNQSAIGGKELAAGRMAKENVNEVVISDYLADQFIYWPVYGEKYTSYSDVIQRLRLKDIGGGEISVCGVLKTDCDKFDSLKDVNDKRLYDVPNPSLNKVDNLYGLLVNKYHYIYSRMYCSPDMYERLSTIRGSVRVKALQWGDKSITGRTNNAAVLDDNETYYFGNEHDGAVVCVSQLLGLVQYSDMKAQEGGTEGMFAKLADIYAGNTAAVVEGENGLKRDVRVVGFVDDYVNENLDATFYLSEDVFKQFAVRAWKPKWFLAPLTSSAQTAEMLKTEGIITNVYNTRPGYVFTFPERKYVDWGYEAMLAVLGLGSTICLIIAVLALMYIFNEASHDLRDNRRTYAIFKSLGASDARVAVAAIFKTLLLLVTGVLLSYVVLIPAMWWLNSAFTTGLKGVTLVYCSPLTILTESALCAIIVGFALLFGQHKLRKKPLIETLKEKL